MRTMYGCRCSRVGHLWYLRSKRSRLLVGSLSGELQTAIPEDKVFQDNCPRQRKISGCQRPGLPSPLSRFDCKRCSTFATKTLMSSKHTNRSISYCSLCSNDTHRWIRCLSNLNHTTPFDSGLTSSFQKVAFLGQGDPVDEGWVDRLSAIQPGSYTGKYLGMQV